MATSVSPSSHLSLPLMRLLLPPLAPSLRPVLKAPPRRKQSPPLLLLSQITALQSQTSDVSCVLPSVLAAGDRSIDPLLFALDWREQIFIFMLTLESVNPAQPFAQDVASHR